MKTSRRNFSLCLLLAAACSIHWSATAPDAAAQSVPIFWVEGGAGFNGRLGRVNVDGSGFQVLLTGLNNPLGVDIDPFAGHVYWSEPGPTLGTGRIRRADLNGNNVIDVVTGLEGPAGLALDFNQSKIYWTNASYHPTFNPNLNQPTVERANFDGSNVETLITGPNAIAIDVDSTGGKMYYAAGLNTNSNYIQEANLNGTGVQTIYTAPVTQSGTWAINGVTVGYDFDFNYYPGGRLYFTMHDGPNGTVESIALNGGTPTTIASHNYPFFGVDHHPYYARVVSAAIFGDANNSGEISWYKPDGSLPQLISTVGLNLSVNDVAVWPFLPTIPEPATAVMFAAGAAALTLLRKRMMRPSPSLAGRGKGRD